MRRPGRSAEDTEDEGQAAPEETEQSLFEQRAPETSGTIDAETREIRLDELRAAREQAGAGQCGCRGGIRGGGAPEEPEEGEGGLSYPQDGEGGHTG